MWNRRNWFASSLSSSSSVIHSTLFPNVYLLDRWLIWQSSFSFYCDTFWEMFYLKWHFMRCRLLQRQINYSFRSKWVQVPGLISQQSHHRCTSKTSRFPDICSNLLIGRIGRNGFYFFFSLSQSTVFWWCSTCLCIPCSLYWHFIWLDISNDFPFKMNAVQLVKNCKEIVQIRFIKTV